MDEKETTFIQEWCKTNGTSELDNYILHLTEDEKDALFILSIIMFMNFGGKEEQITEMIEFNKMTEELEEVVNKYGLTIDLSKLPIG